MGNGHRAWGMGYGEMGEMGKQWENNS